jgi:hypothetical protein
MRDTEDSLRNLRLKIFIDGEYKGTIRNGDPLPSEWLGDCCEHTFGFEVDMDDIEVRQFGFKDVIRILENEKI